MTLWRKARDSVTSMASSTGRLVFEELGKRLQAIVARGEGRRRRVNLAALGRTLDNNRGALDNIADLIAREELVDVNVLKQTLKGLLEASGSGASRSESECKVPTAKAAGLAARALHVVYGFGLRCGSVLYDVHVAKVTLKLGLVRLKMDGFEVVAVSLFRQKALRKSVIKAWELVSELAGLHPLILDAFLWRVGRDYCLFDDTVVSSSKRSLCPAVRAGRRCPLGELCASARGEVDVVIFSRNVAGVETAVFKARECRDSSDMLS